MSKEFTRRQFLIDALATTAYTALPKKAKELPNWLETISPELFQVLVDVCTKIFDEDVILDVLDLDYDYNMAIDAAYSFLMQYYSIEDADKLLIINYFFEQPEIEEISDI